MEKVSLYIKRLDADGNEVLFPDAKEPAKIGTYTYNAQRMGGAPTITATLMYKRCLDDDWTHEEYVEFRGEKYYVTQVPTSSKSNDSLFYKHELTFQSERAVLDNTLFFDVVTDDIDEQYIDRYKSNDSKVTFYGDINEFASRLTSSMIYSGLCSYDANTKTYDGYHVVVDEGITSDIVEVSFDGKYLSEALQEIYSTYGLTYYFVGKVCHVGYTENVIATPFEYGFKKGLYSITKSNANKKLIDRITGKGSDTNIPYYYPNESADGTPTYVTNGFDSSLVEKIDLQKMRSAFGSSADTFTWDKRTIEISQKDASVRINLERKTQDTPFIAYHTFYITLVSNKENVAFTVTPKFSVSDGTCSYIGYKASYDNTTIDSSGQYIEIGNGKVGAIFMITSTTPNKPINLSFNVKVVNNDIHIGGNAISRMLASQVSIEASLRSGYGFTSSKGTFVLYGDSGIIINEAISRLTIGDTLTITCRKFVTPMSNLMPSVYRESEGAERFYNATNGTYSSETYLPETNGNLTFKNPYIKGKQHEAIQDFDDIKPTIEGITNTKGQLFGEIADVAFDENDNDLLGDGTTNEVFNGTDEYVHSYFYIKLNIFNGDYGFNLFDYASESEEAYIQMTSGNCAACKFQIGVCKKGHSDAGTYYTFHNPVQVDNNGDIVSGDFADKVKSESYWQDQQQDTYTNSVWIAVKKENDTFGIVMPNATNNYKPQKNDSFVITGINMPKVYILAAEKRLDAALIEYMKENNEEHFDFSANFSRIFLAENESIFNLLNENARVTVNYNGVAHTLYISDYTVKADANILYEVNVELAEELTIGESSIKQQISAAKSDILASIGKGNTQDFIAQGTRVFLSKTQDDTAEGTITFLKGILLGESGSGITIDGVTGESYATVDRLKVNLKAYFEELEICKTSSIAGKEIVTPGGGKVVAKVEEITDDNGDLSAYRCYYLAEQEGEAIDPIFKDGDEIISKNFNAKAGVAHQMSNHFYWRRCINASEDVAYFDGKKYYYVDLSATDCAEDSTIPAAGDTIVQLGAYTEDEDGNETTDILRQNAIVISSTDSDSPSITLYHGIKNFTLTGNDFVTLGFDPTTGHANVTIYGDFYAGDRPDSSGNSNSYVKYDRANKKVSIKGVLEVGTKLGDSDLKALIDDAKANGGLTEEQVQNIATTIVNPIKEDLQKQIDGAIETWFYDGVPTLSNKPASTWTDNTTKDNHLGDLYYDNKTGYAYRFKYDSGTSTYSWERITDTDVTKALANAATAQETADGKMKVFVKTPTPPYQVGDIWLCQEDTTIGGTTFTKGNIYRATTAKSSGTIAASDFIKADKYTDDTLAQKAKDAADQAQTDATEAVTKLQAWADDGVISPVEKQEMLTELERIKGYMNDIKSQYDTYDMGELPTAFTTAYNAYKEILTKFTATDTWDEDITIPSDFSTKQANFYDMRTSCLTAIAKQIDEVSKDVAKQAAAAQKAADNANTAAEKANTAVTDLNTYVDGTFKDGIITSSEAQAIATYVNEINALKTDMDKTYAVIYGNTYLDDDSKKALKTAYDSTCTTITNLLTTINNAIADSKVDKTESAAVDNAYDAFVTKYGEFSTALEKANKAIQDKLKSYSDQFNYLMGSLKDAAAEGLTTLNGLVLSNAIGLTDPDTNTIMAGISGVYDSTLLGKSIAAWYGGAMVDKEANPDATDYARALFRMDGSGYIANDNISWTKDGSLTFNIQNIGFTVGGTMTSAVDYLEKLWLKSNNNTVITPILDIAMGSTAFVDYITIGNIKIVYDSENNALKVVNKDGKTAANFYATGGVSAKGISDDGSGNSGGGLIKTVYNSANFGGTFESTDNTATFNAHAINSLYNRLVSAEGTISNLANGGASTFETTGSGNVVTSVAKDGTVVTVTKGITALTSHQSIYKLTLQAGKFAATSYTPNSAAVTVNIPTTTAHITESGNLYYTDARVKNVVTQSYVNGLGINASTLSGYKVNIASSTRDTWGTIPTIGGTDGVMEVGKYIDFHVADGSTVDYDVRITANTTGLTLSGTTVGTFSGSLSGNASTATALTTSAGSSTIPVYFSGGKPVQCSTTLGVSITGTAATATKLIGFNGGSAALPIWGHLVTGNSYTAVGVWSTSSGGGMAFADKSSQTSMQLDGTFWQREGRYEVIDTSTVNNYAPTKTGTGASGTWGISISGNSATATKLATARKINGTSFDGTGDITTANWGTARTITIGNTGKSVNGSGNVSWSLSEIGAAAASHTHSYLPLAGGTMTGTISTSKSTGTYLAGNQGTTIINSTASAGAYVMLAKMNSTNGYFTTGSYQGSYLLQYTTKATVTAGTNSVTKSVTLLNESGNSSFPGTVTAPTFSGALSGNASTASKLATARTITLSGSVTGSASFDGSGNITIATTTNHTHSYIPLSGSSAITGNLEFSNITTGSRGIIGTIGDNDYWRIIGGATATNAGYLEIATADDGNEPIYVRQYSSGKFSTLARTATLLDASGNTSFPGTVTAPTFKGALSGNATTASTLATARTIALAGAMTGSTSFNGGANVTITASRRAAIVGQSGSTTTNPYYKFASISVSSTYTDNTITFHVWRDHGDGSKDAGILTAHFRTNGSGYWESGELVWEYANSSITTGNFILAHNASTNPTVVELWVKDAYSYNYYHFDVISEGGRSGNSAAAWTLYNTSSAGSASAVTSGLTQITSTLNTINNNVSTATALQTARTLWGQSFNGTANVSGNMTGVGSITATGGIISSSPNAFRLSYGSYGVIQRNDGSSFYMLLTNSGSAASDSWNSLRPFAFSLSTGYVTIGNGLTVNGSTTHTGDLTLNTGAIHVFPGSHNFYSEGLRLHKASDSWCTIILCGADNTGSTGTSANSWSIHNTAANCFSISRNSSDGANGLFINQSGNMGIGTTSPSVKLHVAGDILATGGVTARSTSDLRLKSVHGQQDYTHTILALGDVFNYTFNDTAKQRTIGYTDDNEHIGLAWQTVKDILPTATGMAEDGYGYINYICPDMIGLTIGALQQNIKKTISNEQRIKNLEDENMRLKEKIRTLERRIA